MIPNSQPHRPLRPGQLLDARGGVLKNKIPDPIPWDAYIGCGLRVMNEGKLAVVVLAPEHTTDLDEVVSLFRLLLAMHGPKPGPLAWETVPENVRRHFKAVPQSIGPNQAIPQ